MAAGIGANDDSSLVGQIVGGTYRIGRLIGQGGMGAVFEAHHVRVPRRFAIKVLRGVVARNQNVLARFRREAMIGSQLGHEHIVQVFDFDYMPDGTPYLVMELLQGQGLETVIAEGPLALVRAATIARQVAVALADAHDHGIVHRDLKPENIFLCQRADGGETAKVLDFGVCKVLSSQTIVTADATVFGSPRYMAPEQALGRVVDINERTDIFALGLVLFHMLAGRAPFEGDSPAALVFQVVYAPLPSIGELRPDLPASIVALVEKAASKEPQLRHASARELIADLDRAMACISADPTLASQATMIAVPSESVPPVSPEHLAATSTGPPAPWRVARSSGSSRGEAVPTGTTLSSTAAELGGAGEAHVSPIRWLLGGVGATLVVTAAVFIIVWSHHRPGPSVPAPARPTPSSAAAGAPVPASRPSASAETPASAPTSVAAPASTEAAPATEPAAVAQPPRRRPKKAIAVKKRARDKKSSAAAKRAQPKKRLLGEGLPDD